MAEWKRLLAREWLWFLASILIGAAIAFAVTAVTAPTIVSFDPFAFDGTEPVIRPSRGEVVLRLGAPDVPFYGLLAYVAIAMLRITVWSIRTSRR